MPRPVARQPASTASALLRDGEGTAWFMELNGRAWGSMALARRLGHEYPRWAVQAALGEHEIIRRARCLHVLHHGTRAADEVRRRRCEEHQRADEILRLSPARRRSLASDPLAPLAGRRATSKPGLVPTWKDRVDLDSVCGELNCPYVPGQHEWALDFPRLMLRAEAVRNWLTQNGNISQDRISVHPVGEADPVASNQTAEGRQQNRRVEIVARRGN